MNIKYFFFKSFFNKMEGITLFLPQEIITLDRKQIFLLKYHQILVLTLVEKNSKIYSTCIVSCLKLNPKALLSPQPDLSYHAYLGLKEGLLTLT